MVLLFVWLVKISCLFVTTFPTTVVTTLLHTCMLGPEFFYKERKVTEHPVYKVGTVSVNVTLRRVGLTTVAVEKEELLHILSVCLYP
jgi:hypothetical protein